jgi:hypothetical protein
MRSRETAAAPACNPRVGRRSGATLIEVLVAIFVMGIGLLAILVLFPLGALNMAQAIRNDRCSQAALNAAAIARFLPHDNVADPTYVSSGSQVNYGLRSDPAVTGIPGGGTNYYTTPGNGLPPVASGPSYPVYIDPAGAKLNPNPTPPPPLTYANPGPPLGYAPPQLAGSGTVTGVPRLMPQYLVNAPQNVKGNPPVANTVNPPVKFPYLTSRYFTLLDDISFASNGEPDVTSSSVERDGRYTWCYMLQMPSASDTNYAKDANLTIVVYDRRTLLLDTVPNLTTPQPPRGERSFEAKFDGTSNLVTLTWDPTLQDAPAVRRGSWILDASLVPSIHGYFYRVVGTSAPVAVSGNKSTMQVELQDNAQASVDQGVAVVMENVVEVFQRGANK